MSSSKGPEWIFAMRVLKDLAMPSAINLSSIDEPLEDVRRIFYP
jgi:hypothetical protein